MDREGNMSTEKLQPAVTAFCLLRAGCTEGLTKATFDADVSPAFAHRMSNGELKAAYEAARSILTRSNLAHLQPRTRVALGLTEEGRSKACAIIGLPTWPNGGTWAKLIGPRLIGGLVGKKTAQSVEELLSAIGLRRAILAFKEGKTPKTKKLSEEAQRRAAAYVGSRSRDIRAVRK